MSIRYNGLLLVLALTALDPAGLVGAPLNQFFPLGTSGDFVNDVYYDMESDTAILVGDSLGTETISGEVIGNGAKLYAVGPNGNVADFLFPDTTFGQAISANGRFVAVSTQIGPDQWDSQIYDRLDLDQPWRSFTDFQAFDVADNGDAVGDFISPTTVSPRLATGDGIIDLEPPEGNLMLGRAFGVSSDGSMIFGSTARDDDFAALVTRWDNNLAPEVLPHDHTESGFPTGSSPSGQFLIGIDFVEFMLPEGLIFETSSIPVWKDEQLLGYMHGVDGEPLRGIDFEGLEFSGGTDITDRGLAIMNTSTGPHAWWPTLHEDRPDLNLASDQAIPFTQAFPDLDSASTSIIGATAAFADDAGVVHFALDSIIDGEDFAPVYVATHDPTYRPTLQAGDADQDRKFDQLDLVRVQVTAKYLAGVPATWGEGDWDGAPGGTVGAPPAGDGRFNQRDIIAALSADTYLTGPYAAVKPGGQQQDEQTSIGYDADTGEIWIDAPASTLLTSVNIDSASAVFSGDPATNLGGSFDNDVEENVFKAVFGSAFGSLSFGNIAPPGLAEEFLQSDLTVVGSLAGGGGLGDVDLIYIAEPSSLALLTLGSFAVIGLIRARQLRNC